MFGITNLYSKKNNPQPIVINYGPLPDKLKVQINYILQDFFNRLTDRWGNSEDISTQYWDEIDSVLRREHGLEVLYEEPLRHVFSWYKVCQYFKQLDNIKNELDVVHIACLLIESCSNPDSNLASEYAPQQAIKDINTRLQEHGAGYRYQEKEIIKVPSEFTYNQAIEPALVLLHQTEFENAQQEFISAFEHYKKGPKEYEEALTDCLKAIESTIKIIATARKWVFNKPLIALVIKEGLVPIYSESFLAGVRNTLESGVPTLRNKLGGHGKGIETRVVDDASMHYCINLTASILLYLVQCHQEIPK